MYQKTHHIPILAGFEIKPDPQFRPILDKQAVESIAHALATDLARCLPTESPSLLVVGGVVAEPSQLLQPGLGVWLALEQLSKPVIRDQGLHSGVLAIGAHQGLMPDDRLNLDHGHVTGQFMCVPMLLVTSVEDGPSVEAHLETHLFEFGSINPPARAALSEHANLESIHGQLLTLNDLMALQRVQLDAAGLSGFWDVIEIALLHSEHAHDLKLPGQLTAQWSGSDRMLLIDFLTLDQWLATSTSNLESVSSYLLWLRAYRTLTVLADSHNISWTVTTHPPSVIDESRQCVIETSVVPSEIVNQMANLTQHMDPSIGLVAWSLIEDGRLIHLYPMTVESIKQLQEDFNQRDLSAKTSPTLCYNLDFNALVGLPS